jgi:pimeloyl-ACP methyl ester carboxylesterase
MAKFNNTDIRNDLMIENEDLYIFPISEPVYTFLEKVWSSFCNKMVALVFPNQENIFDHSVFEVIKGHETQIVASSTHFKMKEMIGNQKNNKDIQDFIKKTKPIAFSDPQNESVKILQRAIAKYSHMQRPEVEIISLRHEDKLHPNLKVLLTETMRYAVGIPLIVKENPIGVLWGIRRRKLTEEQIQELTTQLHTLFDVIEYVIALEIDRKGDPYFARKNIEKSDTTSTIHHLMYTLQQGQLDPVTSIVAYSHSYNMMYRLDASYIVPTSNGFSVSLKHFAPEQMNDKKKIILTIPGFFCRRSVMDKVSKEMSLRYGYRVFSMDMRGRSRYTLPKKSSEKYSWTMDDYIQDDFPAVLKWIIDNYPDHEVVVMGHSMGGMIPRFYTSSYDRIKSMPGKDDRIDPYKYITGIVAITSPNYIDMDSPLFGLEMIKSGFKFLSNRMVYDMLFNIVSFPMKNTLTTIDLNSFFKFILNLHSSLRQFSFQISTKIVNLNDFVGYKQISPPEWYFLVEDVFCEESVKVILQFIRSQLSHENGFYSYDGTINYTKELENINLPIFTIVGSIDKIVPASTIRNFNKNVPHKKVAEFEQGHLGIIFHQPTVEEICRQTQEWIIEIETEKMKKLNSANLATIN